MRVVILIGLLTVVAGCCSKASNTQAELARLQRERDEYAAQLEETQTILNHTRGQLTEAKKALNELYAARAVAVARLTATAPATQRFTVDDPPPGWDQDPQWRDAVMKYRQERAKQRAEEKRARSRPTTQ